MTAKRRSRRRGPLTEFGQRSPLHAFAAGVIRFALLAGLAAAFFLVIMNVIVPDMIDNLVEEFRSLTR